MKTLYSFLILTLAGTSLASDFNSADSILTEATRINSLTAKRKIAWNEEKSRLEALEQSYKAILKTKRERVKNLEFETKNIAETASPISLKIKDDEARLKSISSRLDFGLATLMSEFKEILKDEAISPSDYKSKNELEKLSLFCRIRDKLKLEEERVVQKNGEVATGARVVARGKIDGDIAVLTVEKGARK